MTKSVENKGVKEKSGLKFTKVLITVIILSLAAIVLAQEWQQIPLRTAKQKAAGLKGGEGCQQIMDIAYAPSNPKVVYLISDTSQTWKSSDGGFNWKMCHNGLHANGGFSIVVDPNNENIVFVASCIGRGLSPGTEKSLSGICRSVNGAESWQMVKKVRFFEKSKGQKHQGKFFAFDKSSFDGKRTKVIYAGSYEEGFYKSTDGDDNWIELEGFRGYRREMSIWMPDIAPTLSGYLGFPMSQHSDGKIIADIFET